MFRPLLISMFLTSTALADTWTVDDDGKADFENIQAAIDAASDGDEIIVMPGTYTSTQDGHVVNMLGKAVTLRSSNPSDPDVVAATIIDGEGARRGIVCFNNETEMTLIKGLTITNGQAVVFDFDNNGGASTYENDSGGGMYCFSSNPTIEDCIFNYNTTGQNTSSGEAMGAAIFCHHSDPAITRCMFNDNTAMYAAGGISCEHSSPLISNCTFLDNDGGQEAGGICVYYSSNPTITGCILIGNTGLKRGGGIYGYHASATINSCFISENICLSSGGGVRIGGYFDLTLVNTIICGNTPDQIIGGYTDGGGNIIADVCPSDSDNDGIPDTLDNCYLYNPDQADCNGNGIGDVCDVADSTSFDCDQNNVPDECQPDCDGDGWIDACDNEADCDDDGIPDNCELDCNENNIPDDCDIIFGISEDCNENGVPDECDIADGTANDCNFNGIPDSCDITDGAEEDCNENGVPDSCDVVEVSQKEYKIFASDGEEYAEFGCSVSIDIKGSTAIVGAWRDDSIGYRSGSAYIYQFDGNDWIETKLIASDGEPYDTFGDCVSISGNGTAAIVGSMQDDNGSNSGSAYIYRFDGDNWIEHKLTASDGASYDSFGSSVSISGDGNTALVGAPEDDTFIGSAYIYQFNGSSWIETKLLASDSAQVPHFGNSVSISSDGFTAVVGASRHSSGAGAAYIYSLVNNKWQETILTASDGEEDAQFGYSVSISSDGSTAIVGAKSDDDTGFRSGSAYIYEHIDGYWQETKLLASDAEDSAQFGNSVSISSDGTTAIVGAKNDNIGDDVIGAAYIYEFRNGKWLENKLSISNGNANDFFGESVAISGNSNKAIVGAYGEDKYSGSAYIYDYRIPWEYDCNANGEVDSCEIADNPSLDCDEDGLLDSCAIEIGQVEDCNENGIPDNCELEDPDNDQNNNGVLDECECVGDADLDGYVNVTDLLIVVGYWGNNTPQADLNFDGIVNVLDLLIVIDNWGTCE